MEKIIILSAIYSSLKIQWTFKMSVMKLKTGFFLFFYGTLDTKTEQT